MVQSEIKGFFCILFLEPGPLEKGSFLLQTCRWLCLRGIWGDASAQSKRHKKEGSSTFPSGSEILATASHLRIRLTGVCQQQVGPGFGSHTGVRE